ncbi:LysR family transcriptional regulator [Neptunomonas phycophila]|uniref:LysR family transcriptional regulator n=1 Tax=Neptunomonas phycophila TaxID=1572645 RepID=UPI0015BC0ECE|nr:LysR family transcriptional regulator [Neptunomonas phycophila]QLE96670.1 LysR family transcriptional regulator [Neptunomonas phycophila]
MTNKTFSIGQLGDYEIKQLKIFKTVVECGGFAAAETRLNISRPTISIHIANLESRLHLTLCKRGRGGFALTEEGAIVFEQTEKLLDMLEGFRNTVNNLSHQPSGNLKVGLSDTFSIDPRCQLPLIINAFSQVAEDVELCMSVEQMASMECQVLNDELDIAFIPYHRKLEGLNYIHLFRDDCYLYASTVKGLENPLCSLPDIQLTDELINQAPLVHAGLKPHEEIYHQLSEMHLAGISYHYESRIAMLLSGRYIGFLPQNVAQPYVEKGDLKAIAPDRKHFSLGAAVISKKTAQANRARDLFLSTVKQQFGVTENPAPY